MPALDSPPDLSPDLSGWAALASLVTVLAVPALVWARSTHRTGLTALSKTCASLGFLTAGLLLSPAEPRFGLAVRVGLGLAVVGDLLLIGRARRWVLGGLVAFLLAHLAYAAGALTLTARALASGGAGALASLGLTVLIGSLAGRLAGRWILPRTGDLRGPVTAYLVVVSLSGTALIAVAATDPTGPGRWSIAAAGALLWISDLAVARQRLMVDSFWNRVWGLPTYYAGQLLLVWALPLVV